MPFKLTKLPGGGMLCEYEGAFTREVSQEAKRKLGGKNFEKLAKISYLIVDHTKTELGTFSTDDIRKLAQSTKAEIFKLFPDFILAIVAPADLGFGLARVWFAHLAEEERAGIFRTRPEAEAWIWKKLKKTS